MLPWLMLGGMALSAVQKDAEAKRQNILDQADAKWSGFKQFQKSKAGANAPWVEGIMDGAGTIADYEQKNPGKTGALGKWLLGQESVAADVGSSGIANAGLSSKIEPDEDILSGGDMYENLVKKRNITL